MSENGVRIGWPVTKAKDYISDTTMTQVPTLPEYGRFLANRSNTHWHILLIYVCAKLCQNHQTVGAKLRTTSDNKLLLT